MKMIPETCCVVHTKLDPWDQDCYEMTRLISNIGNELTFESHRILLSQKIIYNQRTVRYLHLHKVRINIIKGRQLFHSLE